MSSRATTFSRSTTTLRAARNAFTGSSCSTESDWGVFPENRLHPVQPEFVHTEARGQFDGGGRDAATAATGSNPITETGKTVDVIDAVDANAAQQFTGLNIENHEAVVLIFLPVCVAFRRIRRAVVA